jgi:predicted RNA binding protein YcfA (HicA-like mRNA interferase family)
MQMLRKDGWVLDRVSSDHHTLKHPARPELITITHPRKDIPTGLVRAIHRIAGWKA